MDAFQKRMLRWLRNAPVEALLRWLSDFSSFSLSSDGFFVCQKISTQSPEDLLQFMYFACVWEVYLMQVINYTVSGLSKADW